MIKKILLLILVCASLTANVWAQGSSISATDRWALKTYCRIGGALGQDVSRCGMNTVPFVVASFAPYIPEQKNTPAIPQQIIKEVRTIVERPVEKIIYIRGEKGEKGDTGNPGSNNTNNLQAFQNIPMPFWSGAGSSGSIGGGSTIVNNITNIFGSSSTSSLASLQDAYNFGGAGLGKEINTTTGGAVDIKVQDGLGLFNGLTITGATNTTQGMIFGKSNFGGGQQAAFGFSDDIANVSTSNGMFSNYNFASNKFTSALLTAGVSSADMALGNPATSLAAIDINAAAGNTNILRLSNFGIGAIIQHVGNGSPEGVVTGNNGDVFFRTNSNTPGEQMYVKGGGNSNVGWVAVGGVSTSTSPITIENGNSLFATGLSLPSGAGATAANNSVFLGLGAGGNAVNAGNSNFLGASAGNGATDAFESNFFGANAGTNAANANSSNFFGINAGTNAANANNSNFFGSSAGNGATGASESNFFGSNAGLNADGAFLSNFFGNGAGQNANNANFANFLGVSAGNGATGAANSNFIGRQTGQNAFNANNSNFLGTNAGQNATNAALSNFIGDSAGSGAINANNSNFIGQGAGEGAINANNSNFFGTNTGNGATDAFNSTFLGTSAGLSAMNAANSIFIGTDAGNGDAVNNIISGTSILIGANTRTGGFSNSISLGARAANTATNQFTLGSTFDADSSISELYLGNNNTNTFPLIYANITGVGIGKATPSERLDVAGNIRFSGALMPNNLAGATGTILISQGNGLAPLWVATSSLFSISSSTIASNFGFINNGNSFGGLATLGTNDLQGLAFETNNTQRANFRSDNSFGLELFNLDTTSGYAYSIRNTVNNNNYSLWDGLSQDWLLGFNSNQFLLLDRTDGRDMMRITKAAAYTTVIGDTTTPTANTISLLNNNAGYTSTVFGLNSSRKFFISDGIAVRFWIKPSNVLSTDTVGYESLVVADNDIPNRRFVFNNFFAQNGNAFGAVATIGTTDSNSVRIIASSTEALRALSSGFVGIGTAIPTERLQVGDAGNLGNILVFGTGTTCSIGNGTGATLCSSDERLKNTIATSTDSLLKIRNLRPVTYIWNSDLNRGTTTQLGLIAQEVEQTFPELVDEVYNGYKGIDYAALVTPLIGAVQELDVKIEDLIGGENMPLTALVNGVEEKTFVGKLFDRMTVWFADAGNGITNFFANRVHTKELCVGEVGNETCINKGQLDLLLQGQLQNTQTNNTSNTDTSSGTGSQGQGDGTGTTTAETASPTENQDNKNTVLDTNEDIIIHDTNTGQNAVEEIVPQP